MEKKREKGHPHIRLGCVQVQYLVGPAEPGAGLVSALGPDEKDDLIAMYDTLIFSFELTISARLHKLLTWQVF